MEISDGLEKNLLMIGISIVIVGTAAAAHNFSIPDEPVEVGPVEVETTCVGIDLGACIGIQRQEHTSYNYDDYENAEPGTEDYYRKVESELMIRAYKACGENVTGMEWTSEVSYQNKTAEEWMQNEEISLLPCEKTFYRELDADR